MNPVTKYNTTLKARLLWMAVPLIYRSTNAFVSSLTNGAGNSMTRARIESKSVKIWRTGTSTMIATNGRELAPGLDDQSSMSRRSERVYMIPAGPRVPPLNNQLYPEGYDRDDSHDVPEEFTIEEGPHRSRSSAFVAPH
jgi:hypothetical protein